MSFSLGAASSTGNYHLKQRKNNQDAFRIFSDGRLALGFVTDGCSKGRHSEVGAWIGANYLLHQSLSLASHPDLFPLIPQRLFTGLESYLGRHLEEQGMLTATTKDQYIDNFLLFTVLGFIYHADASDALVFYCGDGVININGQTLYLDQGNRPHYLAYRLMSPAFHHQYPNVAPLDFTVLQIPTATLNDLVIASDAFLNHEDLLLEAGQNLTRPVQLQLRLNVWVEVDNLFGNEGDDATLVALHLDQQEDDQCADAST